MSAHDPIELEPEAEENGFALMLSQLLRQNLVDHPHKRRDFDRLRTRVAIIVEDAEVAVTLRFLGGHLVLHDGLFGIPDITIRAQSDDVMQMSLVELLPRVGLPDPRGENTRKVAARTREGQIRTVAGLMQVPALLRLTRVLSVNA